MLHLQLAGCVGERGGLAAAPVGGPGVHRRHPGHGGRQAGEGPQGGPRRQHPLQEDPGEQSTPQHPALPEGSEVAVPGAGGEVPLPGAGGGAGGPEGGVHHHSQGAGGAGGLEGRGAGTGGRRASC